MFIVVESGATKAHWRIAEKDGREVAGFLTPGTNVSSMRMETVLGIIDRAGKRIRETTDSVEGIYYYTAGVVTREIETVLTEALSKIAPGANIEVQTDLMASARAACGHGAGIAAILGTGSNSCFFDGRDITRRVYSGGFIIGDEGSAATLGRLFVSDVIKRRVPESVFKEFCELYDASYQSIVENVYHSALSPAGYLGGMAPFILKHYGNPYIKQLVDGNFQAFIDRCLLEYDTEHYAVGVIGGFGNAAKDIFTPLCEKAGIRIREYIPEPIKKLIEYHAK